MRASRLHRQGFTLIELVVVLAISGLLVGYVLQAYNVGQKNSCYLETKEQLQAIKTTVEAFARKNDRYPLPAARNVGIENPDFGHEATNPAQIDAADGISRGALPIVALGLPMRFAADCFGNKYTYAVTTALTTNNATGGFPDVNAVGTIHVIKGLDAMELPVESSSTAAYAIISHGEDELGAARLNYEDSSHKWCDGNLLRTINCHANADTVADALFNNGRGAGATYFDDFIVTADKARQLYAGNIFCWGRNTEGELGTGNTTSSVALAQAQTNSTFTSLSTGSNYTCGIDLAGKAYCWGTDTFGVLGNGSATGNVVRPAPVSSGETFITISAAADHACAVTTSGAAYCWGNNAYGQVGGAPGADVTVPTLVPGQPGQPFVAIGAGTGFTCGLTNGDEVHCWGKNDLGQLGDGTNTPNSTPHQISSGGINFTRLAVGSTHACAIGEDTNIYCWGDNAKGELGLGSSTGVGDSRTVATAATPPQPLVDIAAGNANSCGLTAANAAYCWGDNTNGTIGNGTTTEADSPVAVTMPGGITFTHLALHSAHDCATGSDHQTYCWGSNPDGGLGYTGTSAIPKLVNGSLDFGAIAGSDGTHSCGIIHLPCALPWGGYIADGASVTAYYNSSPTTVPCTPPAPCGSAFGCFSQMRVCANGVLSGSYLYDACSE